MCLEPAVRRGGELGRGSDFQMARLDVRLPQWMLGRSEAEEWEGQVPADWRELEGS